MEENKNPSTEASATPTAETPPTLTTGAIKKTSRLSVKAIISTIIFLLLAGGAAAGFVYREQIVSLVAPPQQKACTMEAKLCPDGSSVGRTGPNCEFAPCPTPITTGWETYENLEIGFSFKYPQEIDGEKINLIEQDNIITIRNFTNPVPVNTIPYSINISIKENPKNLSVEKYIDEELSSLNLNDVDARNIIREKIIVGGIKSEQTTGAPSANGYIDVSIPLNKKILYIHMTPYSKLEASDKQLQWNTVLNQILSTFTFTDSIPSPSPTVNTKCVVAGCSGQLCVEEGSENGISTCEYKEEFACYKSATCEKQTNGECGWTLTPELKTCIESAN